MDTPPVDHETPASAGRRQFFVVGARCVAVGSIAAFAAFQEVKRRRLAGDPNCIRLDTCTDCVELGSGCQKDKAVNFRARQGV